MWHILILYFVQKLHSLIPETLIFFVDVYKSHNTLFFLYIRTSNFGAEAEPSFFAIWAWNVLNMFLTEVQTKFDYKLGYFSVYHACNKKTTLLMLKMSLSIWVNCSVRLQFYISFTFTYTAHKKMSKVKTFLTDSQPGYVLSMFLKFWLISAWTFL